MGEAAAKAALAILQWMKENIPAIYTMLIALVWGEYIRRGLETADEREKRESMEKQMKELQDANTASRLVDDAYDLGDDSALERLRQFWRDPANR